jgi:hypothetical protein
MQVLISLLPALLNLLITGFKAFIVWKAGRDNLKKKHCEEALKDVKEVNKERRDIKSASDDELDKRLRNSRK